MGKTQSILEQHSYTLLEELAQGAFGKVLRVKNKNDGKEYVIKAAQKSQSMIHEVTVLLTLKHPFIVEYNDSFEDIVNLYIVMEYCEGGDLSLEIEKKKDTCEYFSEVQILSWFAEISMALQHVHEKKILHRDIKPKNIFLDKYGRIRLGDFGVAKPIERTSEYAQTGVGTFCYMSPERIDNKPYKSKSDMWALGCVLYELCELRPAFPEKSLGDIIIKILNGPYPSISGRFSTNLRDLVRDLLQKNPADRPSAIDVLRRSFILRILVQKNMGTPEELQQKLKELTAVADGLERVLWGTTVGSLTGGVVGAAGGITTIVGLALAPFTFGISAIVAGVGIGVAAAGGVTGAVSNVTNMVNERMDRCTIEGIISELEVKILSMLTCFQHIDNGFKNLEQSLPLGVEPAARGLRGLGGLAKLSASAQAFRAVAQGVRIGRVAEAVTGVFAGLFLALDIYFIVDDARAIHAMRQQPPSTSYEYGRLEVLEEPPDGASTGSQASGVAMAQGGSSAPDCLQMEELPGEPADGVPTAPNASGEAMAQGGSSAPDCLQMEELPGEPADGVPTDPNASGGPMAQETPRRPEGRKALKTREFINEIRKASAEIQNWLDECMPLYSAIAAFEDAYMSI